MNKKTEIRLVRTLVLLTLIVFLASIGVLISSGVIDSYTWYAIQRNFRCCCCWPFVLFTMMVTVFLFDWVLGEQRLFKRISKPFTELSQKVGKIIPVSRITGSRKDTEIEFATFFNELVSILSGNKVIPAIWGATLCFTAICLIIWLLAFQGGGGPNARTAERISEEFVRALHNGDVSSAHQMLVEEARSQLSPDDLSYLLERDEDFALIKKYKSLEVCEFGILPEEEGLDRRALLALGILRYEGGSIVFGCKMQRETGFVWRVSDFQLLPEESTRPWGRCTFRSPQ